MPEGLLPVERPFAVDLAAGNAFDLLRIVPERNGIVHMPADPAFIVAEGGAWLNLADETPLGAPPDQDGPVRVRSAPIPKP
jgi:hypothetical protein